MKLCTSTLHSTKMLCNYLHLTMTACTFLFPGQRQQREPSNQTSQGDQDHQPRQLEENHNQMQLPQEDCNLRTRLAWAAADQDLRPAATLSPVKRKKPAPMEVSHKRANGSKVIHMVRIFTGKQWQAAAMLTPPEPNSELRRPTAVFARSSQHSCSTFCNALTHTAQLRDSK